MKKHPVVDALQKASKGLLFPSESEAPLKPFLWGEAGDKLNPDRLRGLVKAGKGTSAEETGLDTLLQTVPSEDCPKFDRLAKVLREQLADIKVYKVGDEPEKDVYVVRPSERPTIRTSPRTSQRTTEPTRKRGAL